MRTIVRILWSKAMRFRPSLETLPGRITPSVPGPLAPTPIEPTLIPITYPTITVAKLVPPDNLFD
jgi:hypothetical protein